MGDVGSRIARLRLTVRANSLTDNDEPFVRTTVRPSLNDSDKPFVRTTARPSPVKHSMRSFLPKGHNDRGTCQSTVRSGRMRRDTVLANSQTDSEEPFVRTRYGRRDRAMRWSATVAGRQRKPFVQTQCDRRYRASPHCNEQVVRTTVRPWQIDSDEPFVRTTMRPSPV